LQITNDRIAIKVTEIKRSYLLVADWLVELRRHPVVMVTADAASAPVVGAGFHLTLIAGNCDQPRP